MDRSSKFRWVNGRAAKGAIFSLTVLALMSPSAGQSQTPDPQILHLLQMFGGVLDRVKKDYVQEPDDRRLIEGAIQGMLRQGAPGSVYLSPADLEDMTGKNYGPDIGSVGLAVLLDGDFTRVEGVQPNSPALEAGIRPNDIISAIDGQDASGTSLQDITRHLRGPLGSTVKLAIKRGSDPMLTLELKRAHLTPATFQSRMSSGIGVMKAIAIPDNQYVHATLGAFVAANPGMKGMILDLRGCHGGQLSGVIQLADELLNGGEVVQVRGRDPKAVDRYNARPGDILNGKPLVVLIDQETRSGAEIVAAALSDRKRARLVGLPSFGGGNIDTVIPLAGGKDGAIRIMTGSAYRITGEPIQKVGVTPDVLVAQSRSDADQAMSSKGFFSQVDLKNAPDVPGVHPRVRPISVAAPPDGFSGDYQEITALSLIRSMLETKPVG